MRAPRRPNRRRAAWWGAALLIIAAAALAAGLGGLDADVVLARRQQLLDLSALHPWAAAAVFAGLYVAGMSLALPLGGMLGLLAGLLFGRWAGLALVVAAGTVSASLVFGLARRIFGDRLTRLARPGLADLARAMRANGFVSVLAMRIIPAFPFFVVTVVAALAEVRWSAFLLATAIGKVPATFIYTGVGQSLGGAASLDEVVTTESIVGLTCLGLLALTPIAARLVLRRRGARMSIAAPSP